jgi:hypothetical protein
LCYSVNGKPGQAFPDVFDVGEKLYNNATPLNVAQAAIEFISKQIKNQSQKDSDEHKVEMSKLNDEIR